LPGFRKGYRASKPGLFDGGKMISIVSDHIEDKPAISWHART